MRKMRRIGTKRIVAGAVGLLSAVLLASPAGALAAGAMTEFPIPTANALPSDIIAGGDGNLWYTESNTSTIARITPSGTTREFSSGSPRTGTSSSATAPTTPIAWAG
jgi:virginiamycin B lyase